VETEEAGAPEIHRYRCNKQMFDTRLC